MKRSMIERIRKTANCGIALLTATALMGTISAIMIPAQIRQISRLYRMVNTMFTFCGVSSYGLSAMLESYLANAFVYITSPSSNHAVKRAYGSVLFIV